MTTDTTAMALVDHLRPFAFATKVAVLLFFGASLTGSACQIARTSLRSIRLLVESTRTLFLIGTGTLLSLIILAQVAGALLPYSSPVASLVLLGVALVLAVGTIIVDRIRSSEALGPLFLASAGIWLLCLLAPLPSATAHSGVLAEHGRSVLSFLHIATAIVGEGLCAVAFCCALLYLWGFSNLKWGRWEHIRHIPSLDRLEHMLTLSTTVGLVFMTTSLVTGFLVATHQGGLLGVALTKVAWAVGVWCWYVATLFGREMWGWRGKKGAKLSVLGGLLLVVTLFGTFWREGAP